MSKSVILEKFQNLDRCLERIRRVLSENFDEDLIEDIIVLNLQRACQTTIDIASILIKEEGHVVPSTLKEYFGVLAEKKVISKDLSAAMGKMVAFRNIAVHNYEKLDSDIIKAICDKHLSDFTDFKKQVLSVLNF